MKTLPKFLIAKSKAASEINTAFIVHTQHPAFVAKVAVCATTTDRDIHLIDVDTRLVEIIDSKSFIQIVKFFDDALVIDEIRRFDVLKKRMKFWFLSEGSDGNSMGPSLNLA